MGAVKKLGAGNKKRKEKLAPMTASFQTGFWFNGCESRVLTFGFTPAPCCTRVHFLVTFERISDSLECLVGGHGDKVQEFTNTWKPEAWQDKPVLLLSFMVRGNNSTNYPNKYTSKHLWLYTESTSVKVRRRKMRGTQFVSITPKFPANTKHTTDVFDLQLCRLQNSKNWSDMGAAARKFLPF